MRSSPLHWLTISVVVQRMHYRFYLERDVHCLDLCSGMFLNSLNKPIK